MQFLAIQDGGTQEGQEEKVATKEGYCDLGKFGNCWSSAMPNISPALNATLSLQPLRQEHLCLSVLYIRQELANEITPLFVSWKGSRPTAAISWVVKMPYLPQRCWLITCEAWIVKSTSKAFQFWGSTAIQLL